MHNPKDTVRTGFRLLFSKRVFYFLFFLTASVPFLLSAQSSRKPDSLRTILKTAKEDTNKVLLLLQLSNESLKTEPNDSVIAAAERAAQLAIKLHFLSGLGRAYSAKGQGYNKRGDYSSSIAYFTKAYRIFDSLGLKYRTMQVMNSIGNVYIGMKNIDKAYESYDKTVKLAEELKDTFFMAIAFIGKGNIDVERKNYSDAINAFNMAYLRFKLFNHPNAYAALVSMGNAYLASGNPEQALQVLQKEEKTEIGDLYFRERLLYGIGKCHFDLKNYRKAIDYFERALEIDLAKGNYYDGFEVADALASAYELVGDYKKALKNRELFVSLKDSVFNDKLAQQYTEIEAKYQNEENKKEIELLNKDKQLSELELQRNAAKLENSELLRDLLIAIAVVFAGLMVVAWRGYRQKRSDNATIAIEKKKSDDLLLNILPAETAEELKRKGHADARGYETATVLFTDFQGFTAVSERLSPQELVARLNECFTAFDEIMVGYGIEKIKTIGDAYMAAGGIPRPQPDHAERVVLAALAMRDFMEYFRSTLAEEAGFELRIGIHTGPVVAGIVGIKKFAYDIWGDTVNTAARMESSGEVGKVNVSQTTYELVKDKFDFTYRGKVAAKGKGEIEMYFAEYIRKQ
ncbi:MAG: family 3 adenylate cyclase [Bacteroidetes bacterium]|nr:MAG: family 3 adenylate cyclase [Bacteroidota bacterium]